MKPNTGAYLSGLLVANSSPHLATAVTGREHLTPLAGRRSGPAVNAAWGVLNLTGGLLLLARSRGGHRRRWGPDLHWFEAGCLTFAAWMALSERAVSVNTDRR